MWHYAPGVGFAAQSDSAQAAREAAHIAEITQKADFSFLLAWTVPAPDLLRLARHVVEGRIALAQADPTRAIKEFQVAVSIQDSLAYMEPPYWYYPVRQSLGAALLAAGKPAEAEQAFTKAWYRPRTTAGPSMVSCKPSRHKTTRPLPGRRKSVYSRPGPVIQPRSPSNASRGRVARVRYSREHPGCAGSRYAVMAVCNSVHSWHPASQPSLEVLSIRRLQAASRRASITRACAAHPISK
jgi:hypothetical protein